MVNGSDASSAVDTEGEWQTVSARNKKRVMRKKGNRTKRQGVAHATAAQVESVSDVSHLGQILQNCRQALRQTQLYQEITSQVVARDAFCPTEILCYGLGNFSRTHPTYFSASMWQLALLLQLREDLTSSQQAPRTCNPKVYFYDPVSTPHETTFLKQQQIQVLTQDEQGKREMAACALVFMPHCPAILYENLFQTNPTAFRPDGSSSCLLIGNSIRNFCDALSPSIDMPTLRARLEGLDEHQLTVDDDDARGQPGDFDKAFNDTFIVRGKRAEKRDNQVK